MARRAWFDPTPAHYPPPLPTTTTNLHRRDIMSAYTSIRYVVAYHDERGNAGETEYGDVHEAIAAFQAMIGESDDDYAGFPTDPEMWDFVGYYDATTQQRGYSHILHSDEYGIQVYGIHALIPPKPTPCEHNADTGEADQTGYTVRAIYDGETLAEDTFTDAQSHTAAAFYASTLDYWRRQDDDRADGVSVQHIENATGDVLAETTFAMGREW